MDLCCLIESTIAASPDRPLVNRPELRPAAQNRCETERTVVRSAALAHSSGGSGRSFNTLKTRYQTALYPSEQTDPARENYRWRLQGADASLQTAGHDPHSVPRPYPAGLGRLRAQPNRPDAERGGAQSDTKLKTPGLNRLVSSRIRGYPVSAAPGERKSIRSGKYGSAVEGPSG